MANVFFLFSAALYLIPAELTNPFIQSQGIEGFVYKVYGNQMPSPGVKRVKPQGIETIVYIYRLTNLDQVKRKEFSAFYMSIQTPLVRKIETDSNGYFRVQLPPGRYSIFTKKDTLFYANWFDKDNNIFPVEVQPNKLTKIEVRMDADASY